MALAMRLSSVGEVSRPPCTGTVVTRPSAWRKRTCDVAESLTWLRTELPNYYGPVRESAAPVLRYLATMDMRYWQEDAAAAKLVAGAVETDHV